MQDLGLSLLRSTVLCHGRKNKINHDDDDHSQKFFCTFCWSMPKGFFFFYYKHFAFIVFHKPSDTDGKWALVWSGLASGHLTVICWSCAIAWWLSSSEATGPYASQPITAPQHSAVDNYRSVCVTTSLFSIWMAQYQLPLQSVMVSSLLLQVEQKSSNSMFSESFSFELFCTIPGNWCWTQSRNFFPFPLLNIIRLVKLTHSSSMKW